MRERFTLILEGNLKEGGFRVKLWELVNECDDTLAGYVKNIPEGVELLLEGEYASVVKFLQRLPKLLPSFYRLSAIKLEKREGARELDIKRLKFRLEGERLPAEEVSPDYTPCPECRKEAADPASRHFCYPFFGCKDCGPAYSVALRAPFIRKNTSLTAFPLCQECKKEEKDPESPLYHSGKLACQQCGPRFFVLDTYGELIDNENPICCGQRALADGETVALQSVCGGFKLLLNAFHSESMEKLRRKRRKPDKPFKLLARNMESVRNYFFCSEEEEKMLLSPVAPYVILRKKKDLSPGLVPLPSCLAPALDYVAVGLPSTMAEFLLFEHDRENGACKGMPSLLVACGDDRYGHAECPDVEEIFNRLIVFTDKYLCHDLKTNLPCLNSIMREREDGKGVILRRGRGFVPESFPLPEGGFFRRSCIAFGRDRHAAAALAFEKSIIPSQELGRIDSLAGSVALTEVAAHLMNLSDMVPELVICDMDRSLFSTKCALAFAEKHLLPVATVQFHHAQALAVMAEFGLANAIAIAFTTPGFAPDGTYWGAECMEVSRESVCRYASFAGLPARINYWTSAPGSLLRPGKILLETLAGFGLPLLLPSWLKVTQAEWEQWEKALPLLNEEGAFTHSPEYIFTACSCLLGLAPDTVSYPEHIQAILEDAALQCPLAPEEIPEEILDLFSFTFRQDPEDEELGLIDWKPMLQKLQTLSAPVPEDQRPLYVFAFYWKTAESILAMLQFSSQFTEEKKVVLTGSFFKNPVLSRLTAGLLEKNGYIVYRPEKMPPDESSVSLGQAYAVSGER